MPSIIARYEYDIFISYRHKDNKGAHWVTEFVTALKAELDATFKEEISIYFDENPHDGLLEIHHVRKSPAVTCGYDGLCLKPLHEFSSLSIPEEYLSKKRPLRLRSLF